MPQFAEENGSSLSVTFTLDKDDTEVTYKLKAEEGTGETWEVGAYINGDRVGQADLDTVVREIQNGKIGQSEV